MSQTSNSFGKEAVGTTATAKLPVQLEGMIGFTREPGEGATLCTITLDPQTPELTAVYECFEQLVRFGCDYPHTINTSEALEISFNDDKRQFEKIINFVRYIAFPADLYLPKPTPPRGGYPLAGAIGVDDDEPSLAAGPTA